MNTLALHEFHQSLNGNFARLNDAEVVAHYGDVRAEYRALQDTAGVLDLSFRSRICLTGGDRSRFLHGQVTNDVKSLQPGQGCYAALVNAKGRMESDLNIYCLDAELLLDFEPGLTELVSRRLQKYMVADDVEWVDVAPLYGLLSVQGPGAGAVVSALGVFPDPPASAFHFTSVAEPVTGELYLMNQPRLGTAGFDLFIPAASLGAVADKLIAAAPSCGGRACGWQAFETARIEAGIPRFGQDMDESNLPLECGIESRAVSYRKGCYIGQEILNRVHALGHVNKELRSLQLPDSAPELPHKGDKLFCSGKEAGYVTSATVSPVSGRNFALGYVRREFQAAGTELVVRGAAGEFPAQIIELPFKH